VHYEALLPDATGRRLYAGYWDGWQWTPFRGEMVADGTWEGHRLTSADRVAFEAEMRKWGIGHVLVWSRAATEAIQSWPEFARRWQDGPWSDFELIAQPDVRSVVTPHGTGLLAATNPLGARVTLTQVSRGDAIVVRTHFHPSWQATVDGAPLALRSIDGQLAFTAPSDGSYDVVLTYPARRWLIALAVAVLVLLVLVEARRPH